MEAYNLLMLSYRVKGKGLPLVLLHAFPLSSAMWEKQLEEFSEKFCVIAPDLPGFGKSAWNSVLTMEVMARETAILLDNLQIREPIVMMGLSMGGYVAFEFFRHFPERLKAFCLVATRATADTAAARENRLKSIDAMERFGLEPFAKKAVKSQLGKTTQENNPNLVSYVLKLMSENSAQTAIAAQYAMANRRDSSELLSRIKIPVCVIAGEEDLLSSVDEMRGMHEKIKSSRFYSIAGAGHLVNLEQPESFKFAFLEFSKLF